MALACHKCRAIAHGRDSRGRPLCRHCDPLSPAFSPVLAGRECSASGQRPSLDELAARTKTTWKNYSEGVWVCRETGEEYAVVDAPLREVDLEQMVTYARVSGDFIGMSETDPPGFVLPLRLFLERFERRQS